MQIEVKNLSKNFKIAKRKPGLAAAFRSLFHRKYTFIRALQNLSFSIQAGELVGYIGPNGAGKSTTIKILSGILVPNSGEVRVLGKVPWLNRLETVSQIGVVFGQRTQLWWDLPVIDTYELLMKIYKIPINKYKSNLEELVHLLDLSSMLDVPVRQLSLGQRMRCDLAASLLHDPKVLFLDEPTIGLDAVSKLNLIAYIKKINREKKLTIFLTTHDMDDIEALCTRIIVIHSGGIFHDGSMESFRDKIENERRVIIDFKKDYYQMEHQKFKIISKLGTRYTLSFNPKEYPTKEVINDINKKYDVKDLYIENPPIEELVANLYKEATH